MFYLASICGKFDVPNVVRSNRAQFLLSTTDTKTMTPPGLSTKNHLSLAFGDFERDNPNGPKPDHVSTIIKWVQKLPKNSSVVVNCDAGVSRSTAVAMGAQIASEIAESGNDRSTLNETIEHAVKWVVSTRPQADPNMLIIAYFDNALELGGKLFTLAEIVAKRQFFRKHGMEQDFSEIRNNILSKTPI
jgi:predicted protein tyrosine phosphatase